MKRLYITWEINSMSDWINYSIADFGKRIDEGLHGVYIIRSGKIFVYVGSGDIKTRLRFHLKDLWINNYPNLEVNWAEVDKNDAEGVERYLANFLKAKESIRSPWVNSIKVNLPGDNQSF